MERKTFILTYTKDFRLFTRVFLKGKDGKNEQRNVTFTTEHRISEKQRNTNARRIPAEFSTSDERLYDGLLRSPAYGKTFVLKDDPEGKLKRTPFDITPLDARKIALKNYFDEAGLKFDASKPAEVLEEEYRIFANAKTGSDVKESGPAKIEHKPVDIAKEMQDQMDEARKVYEDKYGEPIPEAYANDKALLDGLSNPDFDAKAYMDSIGSGLAEPTIEELREKYLEKKGVNVPNPKKNDAAWIKSKLAE